MIVGKIAFGFLILALCSCSQIAQVEPPIPSTEPRWTVSEEVYQSMAKGSGTIKISLQRQKLFLVDSLGRVAIETDCSTGIPGRETPTGRFLIKEMIVDKRSNKYGKYVSKETGEVVVEKSWEVARKPAGTRYLGIAMPYWMRLTWGGVGIHVGTFQRGNPSSFGCVRMPEKVQPLVYEKCWIGMPVTVQDPAIFFLTGEFPQ